jgi:hypothetical protein
MGMLINGKWKSGSVVTSDKDGSYARIPRSFLDVISLEDPVYQPESKRYHLYVSYACPWAHRTLIYRKLKGLEEHISVSVVHPDMLMDGWIFDGEYITTNKDGEPIRAYFATYVIALCCVFIGHLNVVAPLITQFFLGTYAAISFACFGMSISHSPGWRPSFKFYSKYTALLGGIVCSIIMLLSHLEYAVVAIIIATLIFLYIRHNKPNVNWGLAFESRAKYKANESALRLFQYGDHVKNFQPSFLVLCKDIWNQENLETQALIEYILTLRHGFGVIVFSQVYLGKFEEK